MLYKMLHAPEVIRDKEVECVHQEHCLDRTNPVQVPLSCSKCQAFYDKYVQLSSEQNNNLEQATKKKNTNVSTDSRKLRITSSRVNDLPKTKRGDPEKVVQIAMLCTKSVLCKFVVWTAEKK